MKQLENNHKQMLTYLLKACKPLTHYDNELFILLDTKPIIASVIVNERLKIYLNFYNRNKYEKMSREHITYVIHRRVRSYIFSKTFTWEWAVKHHINSDKYYDTCLYEVISFIIDNKLKNIILYLMYKFKL
jgi:hypothetical protein